VWDLQAAQEASINTISGRNIYPEWDSLSTSQQGGSASDVNANYVSQAAGFDEIGAGGVSISDVNSGAAMGGPGQTTSAPQRPSGYSAKPTTWVIVLGIFIVVIMFAAHKTGNESEFGSIRASGYNILLIGVVAMFFFLVTKTVVGATGAGKTGFGQAVMAA
jgi:hypothetical protein